MNLSYSWNVMNVVRNIMNSWQSMNISVFRVEHTTIKQQIFCLDIARGQIGFQSRFDCDY